MVAVEFGQAEEAPVAQPREDPSFDDLHGDFDLRLVARVSRAGREHRHVVVIAELFDQAVGRRLVAVGPGDQGARLVRHDQARHAADELQRIDDRAHPVGAVLRGRGARVGVVRRAQHRHENLCAADLAAGRIDDGHRLAGVVDEQALAGDVGLAHRALERGNPGAVLDAEARVLVGRRVRVDELALVFLPQQLQGHAGALELLVDPGVIRLELARRARHGGPVQPGFEFFVAQGLGDGPVHAGGARQQDELANGSLAQTDGAGDLGVTQAGFKVQAQGLSYLAHRDPGGRHGGPKNRPACLRSRSLARAAIVHVQAETSSTISLKQRPRSPEMPSTMG